MSISGILRIICLPAFSALALGHPVYSIFLYQLVTFVSLLSIPYVSLIWCVSLILWAEFSSLVCSPGISCVVFWLNLTPLCPAMWSPILLFALFLREECASLFPIALEFLFFLFSLRQNSLPCVQPWDLPCGLSTCFSGPNCPPLCPALGSPNILD